MDYRHKCKPGHYKTVRGKQTEDSFNINCSKIILDSPPRVLKIKTNCTQKLLHSKGNHKQEDNPQNGRKYLQTKQLAKD